MKAISVYEFSELAEDVQQAIKNKFVQTCGPLYVWYEHITEEGVRV